MKYVLKLLKDKIYHKEFALDNYFFFETELLITKKQISELKKAVKVLENEK
jgi:hypothetical protein